ncbi:hypothetical protein P9112_003309 [Eukaryota sp. TZLM1-RC]
MPRHSVSEAHQDKLRNKHKQRTVVLFCQEGTHSPLQFAQDMGKTLGCPVFEMHRFDTGQLHDLYNVILITDGLQHNPTKDSTELFNYLHRERPDLKHINYSVFSTGNHNRIGSNVLAKRFDEKFSRCGARKQFCTFGDSQQGDLGQQYEEFRERIAASLKEGREVE